VYKRQGYGAYETADGRWIYLLMLSDGNWRQFCEAMSLTDRIDSELRSVAERRTRSHYIEELVSQTIRAHSYEESAERLRGVGFGFDEVRPPAEVLDHPQARYVGKLSNVRFNGRDYAVPNLPILIGSVRSENGGSPPNLGEHTLEILDSLGYDASQSDELLERGVIAAFHHSSPTPQESDHPRHMT